MICFALMPITAWTLLFLFLLCRGVDWRIAFLSTSVIWGISVTLLTELLSLFTALNLPCLAAGWVVLAIAAGILLFRTGSFPKRQAISALSREEKFIVFAISGILASTLVQAVVSPPNNFDSMTYHMSRVMHWIQQGSVAHFPTSNLRQIEMNPWAEFAILHFQILTGGDRLANLMQWFSMLGSIIGVSYIAGLLGATRRGQLFSGLLAATLPMAVLQASSTQNDLVVSFWMVCFVIFGMLSSKEKSFLWIALMSCSLGLAILTKGTAYIYAFPFVLWFFAGDVKFSWRRAVWKYSVIGMIVLLVNMGHYQRNFQLFHTPLFPRKTDSPSNNRLTPAVLLSNISRNLTIHILTPSHAVNRFEISALKSFHSVIGIAIDDSGTTWPDTSFEKLRFAPSEDYSGNPLHFLFFAVAFLMLIRKKPGSYPLCYAIAVLGGFILFCAMLRWQPWHSRLHLPMFILFSPVAGLVGAGIKKERVVPALTLVFSLAALAWIILNHSRPMLSLSPIFPTHPPSIFTTPRKLLYLNTLPESNRASFLAVAERINSGQFKNIGLRFDKDAFEYPIWALTREKGGKGPRIEDIDFHNLSEVIPQPLFHPDIILYVSEDGNVKIKGLQ